MSDASIPADCDTQEQLFRSLDQHAPDITILVSTDGTVRYINQAVERILGYTPCEVLGRHVAGFVHPGAVDAINQILEAPNGDAPALEIEIRVRHCDETWRWLGVTASHLPGGPTSSAAIVINARDVTARKQADDLRLERQVRLELLSEIASRITAGESAEQVVARAVRRIWIAFPDLRVVYSTVDSAGIQTVIHVAGPPGTLNVAGLTADLSKAPHYLAALRGTEPIVVPNFSLDPRFAPLAEALAIGETCAGVDVPLQHSEYLVGTLCFDSPVPRAWSEHEVATLAEVAAYLRVALAEVHAYEGRRRMEEALRRNEAHFRSLVQHSWDITLVLAPDHTVQYASQSIERSLGYAPDEVVGGDFLALLHPGDVAILRAAIQECLRLPSAHPHVESRMRHRDGSWRHVEAVATNLLDDPGVAAIVLNARDTTQRKTAEEALTHQAFHDQLTGLPNRALLTDRLSHALHASSRRGEPVALLFVDLDRFKLVNDSLGHEAGDDLIVAAAARLRGSFREEDTLARFGGDEFVAVLEGTGVEQAGIASDRLLEALQQPFVVAGYETTVSACIGIAVSTPDRKEPGDLLRAADMALYEAKRRGRGNWVSFEPHMGVIPQTWFVLETELRRAVGRRELVLHYQPIVDFSTGRLIAAEALVRWQHPERGLVAPAEFLPIAEEAGLIVPIGAWVVTEACQEFAAWRRRYPATAPEVITVNLSTNQLRDAGLVDHVSRALADANISGGNLVLEVTEQVLMEDVWATAEALRRLKALGVRLAIDDFGAGASSLAHFRELGADVLKLDRSLVRGIELDGSRRAVVRAVNGLAHAFGMRVVAEGVETPVQAEMAKLLKCDWGQGYYIAKPLDQADLAAFRPSISRRKELLTNDRATEAIATP